MDDPAELERRAAYIDGIRALHRRKRLFGFVACLVGTLMLIWSAGHGGPLQPLGIAGIVVIAAGWAIFVYVIWSRTRYVRANPYRPLD